MRTTPWHPRGVGAGAGVRRTGVVAESFEKLQQAVHLIERLTPEPDRIRLALQIGRGQHQRTAAQDRPSTRSGTTRFQPLTSFPGSRLESR